MTPAAGPCDDRCMTPAPSAASAPHAPGGPPPADESIPPPPLRKLYRSAEGRMLGGVARGLAGHLGLPVSWVRIVFIALSVTDGLGVLLYAAFWFVVPLGTGGVDVARKAAAPSAVLGSKPRRRVPRPEKGQLFAVLALLIGAAVVADNLQFGRINTYVWPLLLVGLGVVLVWRQADDTRRALWAQVTRRPGPAADRPQRGRRGPGGRRASAGSCSSRARRASSARCSRRRWPSSSVSRCSPGPYLVRMMQDLSEERLMRIRAQERAEVAAHVHDSVLHTLTLIQRNADDPREVARLARAQERELRNWLYKPQGNGKDEDERPSTLAEAVKATAAEVEDHHGVPVEVVCVGDCPLDEGLDAQIQAAREAMVNAAKYGGDGRSAPSRSSRRSRAARSSCPYGTGARASTWTRCRRTGWACASPSSAVCSATAVRPGCGRRRSEGTEVELEMERAAES